MIIDVTGVELTPGNNGDDCFGNGSHYDAEGNLIECCCDECDFLICCTSESTNCANCDMEECPRTNKVF